jgi:hypothetical protein
MKDSVDLERERVCDIIRKKYALIDLEKKQKYQKEKKTVKK